MNEAIKPSLQASTSSQQLPLFKMFPALRAKLPHVSLGLFPTPVQKADDLGVALGLERFYVKRDDLSGVAYGGNKVRMLEFLQIIMPLVPAEIKMKLEYGSWRRRSQ